MNQKTFDVTDKRQLYEQQKAWQNQYKESRDQFYQECKKYVNYLIKKHSNYSITSLIEEARKFHKMHETQITDKEWADIMFDAWKSANPRSRLEKRMLFSCEFATETIKNKIPGDVLYREITEKKKLIIHIARNKMKNEGSPFVSPNELNQMMEMACAYENMVPDLCSDLYLDLDLALDLGLSATSNV